MSQKIQMNLIDRQFEVNVSLEKAWQHLARVEQWTTWSRVSWMRSRPPLDPFP